MGKHILVAGAVGTPCEDYIDHGTNCIAPGFVEAGFSPVIPGS